MAVLKIENPVGVVHARERLWQNLPAAHNLCVEYAGGCGRGVGLLWCYSLMMFAHGCVLSPSEASCNRNKVASYEHRTEHRHHVVVSQNKGTQYRPTRL